MKKNSTLLGIITLGILILAGAAHWYARSHQAEEARPSAGRAAPEFSLQDATGKPHSLAEFQGKPILVHFWAAWCPPCLEEIPKWLELARKYQGKNLGFIAISLDPKWEDALKVLPVDKTPANVVSLIDLSGKLAETYGTYQFPETYVLNSKHEIIYKFVGGQDWNSPQIVQALDKVAGGRPSHDLDK